MRKLNGHGALRSILENACNENGGIYNRSDLTVLSAQVDPYRLDTPSGHRDGKWAAQLLNRAFGRTRRTHWRGLHYAIVSLKNVRKPNGEVYRNTDDDWKWLIDVAGKAARWLGYISFERITDNRNAEPIICRKARVVPNAWIYVGLNIDIPDAEDIEPSPGASGFLPRQAFQFAIFGEKGSLQEVVEPKAREYEADLYLPSGEISDSLLYRMAKDAVEDGRPLIVFTISDCDPAGHQMPVSIGRKLQALRDLLFEDLRFEVVPIALTVDQVRELDLPSTPLKETEKRADKWREAFGVEQTEIDALATLRPDALGEIIDRAFDPYFDRTLEERVADAYVARRLQRITADADFLITHLLEAADSRVCDEGWQIWAGEVRVIEDVEELGAKLQVEALGESGVLVDREVPLFVVRSDQRSAAHVAEVAGADDAI